MFRHLTRAFSELCTGTEGGALAGYAIVFSIIAIICILAVAPLGSELKCLLDQAKMKFL